MKLTRLTHRWACIAFTLAAVANTVALLTGHQATWIGLLALAPLLVLLVTGLVMFVQPYRSKPPDALTVN